jgi:hypothetical protein
MKIDISRKIDSQTQIPLCTVEWFDVSRTIPPNPCVCVRIHRRDDETRVSDGRRLRRTLGKQNCIGAQKID